MSERLPARCGHRKNKPARVLRADRLEAQNWYATPMRKTSLSGSELAPPTVTSS